MPHTIQMSLLESGTIIISKAIHVMLIYACLSIDVFLLSNILFYNVIIFISFLLSSFYSCDF